MNPKENLIYKCIAELVKLGLTYEEIRRTYFGNLPRAAYYRIIRRAQIGTGKIPYIPHSNTKKEALMVPLSE